MASKVRNVDFGDEQTAKKVAKKVSSFIAAQELVDPIIDKHGLEQYSVGPNIFAQTSKVTAVDQHIDQTLRVADWLLEQ